MGLVEGGQQVGLVRLGLDIDAQQRARVAGSSGSVPGPGQGAGRCTGRGRRTAGGRVRLRRHRRRLRARRRPPSAAGSGDAVPRPPRYRQGRRTVDAAHPAVGDIAADHAAVEQVGGRIFGGVTSLAGDLGWPVDAIRACPVLCGRLLIGRSLPSGLLPVRERWRCAPIRS